MRQPTNTQVRRDHPELVDFMRFALAALVIYSHSYALLVGSDRTEPLYRWTRGQVTWGGLAVDAFFILSGFLVTHSWLSSRGLADYMRKRALRIYPAFAVALAVGAFVVAPLSASIAPTLDLRTWLVCVLRLQGYTPVGAFADNPLPSELNGSLWSISYEFWCYVGIALLGISSLLARRRVVLGLLLASIPVSIAFIVLGLRPGGGLIGAVLGYPPFWARLVPYYLAGCVFYLYRERIPLTWPLAALALTLVLLGGVIAPWGVALTFPFALAYLLLFVAFLRIPVLRSWGKVGDFSYGLYLYAFPIQQLLVRYDTELTPLGLFVRSAPLTLLVAIASWYVVEKPFMKLKRARARVRASVPQPLVEA